MIKILRQVACVMTFPAFRLRFKTNAVPIFFLVLSVFAWYCAGLSYEFVGNEIITRLSRDAILVLALVIPIVAGIGLNFGIVLGAIAGQIGYIFVLDRNILGFTGLAGALVIALPISVALGYIVSLCLNRARGKEMITSMILAFLANGVYQMLFMVGYGTIFPSHDKEMLLSRGIGLRDTIDLAGIRGILDKALVIEVFDIHIPVITLAVVATVMGAVWHLFRTPLGQRFKAVGESREKALMAGIEIDRTRTQAIIFSTVIAAIGQIVFLQNIGILNTYTAHRNIGFISSAAILAGGATIARAKIRHVVAGTLLFHTLFVLSPQAGQNFTGSAVIGEYFRSFVMYGTICIALVLTGLKHKR